jgi:hypothetical protein
MPIINVNGDDYAFDSDVDGYDSDDEININAIYSPAYLSNAGLTPGQTFIVGGIQYIYAPIVPTATLANYLSANTNLSKPVQGNFLNLPNIAYNYLILMLQFNEGFLSTESNATIGYGHAVTAQESQSGKIKGITSAGNDVEISFRPSITTTEGAEILNYDINNALGALQSFLGFDRWNYLVNNKLYTWICLMVDKIFNLGFGGFLGYPSLIYNMQLTTKLINGTMPASISGYPYSPTAKYPAPSSVLAGIAKQCQVFSNGSPLTKRNVSNIEVYVYQSDAYSNYKDLNPAYTPKAYYALIKSQAGGVPIVS